MLVCELIWSLVSAKPFYNGTYYAQMITLWTKNAHGCLNDCETHVLLWAFKFKRWWNDICRK